MSNKGKRSRAYPVESLSDAEGTARILFDAFGESLFSRQQGAEAIGHPVGPSDGGRGGRRLAALVQFGLLARISKEYTLTRRALRLLQPADDHERIEMLQSAALSPVLYRGVYDRFRAVGQLPPRLHNLLQRDFGIAERAAPAAARSLVETLLSADLITVQGDFRSLKNVTGAGGAATPGPSSKQLQEPSAVGRREADSEVGARNKEHNRGFEPQRFDFDLTYGRGFIRVPQRLTSHDLDLLRRQLEVLEEQVKGVRE